MVRVLQAIIVRSVQKKLFVKQVHMPNAKCSIPRRFMGKAWPNGIRPVVLSRKLLFGTTLKTSIPRQR